MFRSAPETGTLPRVWCDLHDEPRGKDFAAQPWGSLEPQRIGEALHQVRFGVPPGEDRWDESFGDTKVAGGSGRCGGE